MLLFDWPLLGTAASFFVLSFLMARLVDRLPVWCQTSWFLFAVFGITCVGTITGILYPAAWPYIRAEAFIFLASLPGMMYLDHLQKKSRVNYWKIEGVPIEAQGRIVYLSELIDRFVEWWVWLKIKNELKDLPIPEFHSDDCDCHVCDSPDYSK